MLSDIIPEEHLQYNVRLRILRRSIRYVGQNVPSMRHVQPCHHLATIDWHLDAGQGNML